LWLVEQLGQTQTSSAGMFWRTGPCAVTRPSSAPRSVVSLRAGRTGRLMWARAPGQPAWARACRGAERSAAWCASWLATARAGHHRKRLLSPLRAHTKLHREKIYCGKR
jgi:hypothetical protein